MIIEIKGTILVPGNMGKDCPGNGLDPEVECCCNECDYMLCCYVWHYPEKCIACKDSACPRVAQWQGVDRTG